MSSNVVDLGGVSADFGDMPENEIEAFLSERADEVERARAKVLAEEIASVMPEPPKPQDYSDDLASLGTILLAIREELSKDPKDYSDAFDGVVKAVTGIEFPEQKEIDLTPVVEAVGAIDVTMDVSQVEDELKKIARLMGEQLRKEANVIVQPEAREKITGLRVTERDRRSNEIVEVRFLYEGD